MLDAYIIYNPDSLKSIESSDFCKSTAEKFDLNVIKFPGVYGNLFKLMDQENIILPVVKKMRDDGFVDQWLGPKLGMIGCALSHYFLYKKILETNKPSLILEHDAQVLQDVNELIPHLNECIHLDIARNLDMPEYSLFENANSNQIIEMVDYKKRIVDSFVWKKNWIRGTHGYLISPAGADKIVKWIKEYFLLPPDWVLNSKILRMNYCTNQYVSIQESMSDQSTTGPIDTENSFGALELRDFYNHCLSIDRFTLNDFDQVEELSVDELMKLKWVMYVLSQKQSFTHSQIYNLIKSPIDLESIQKIISL